MRKSEKGSPGKRLTVCVAAALILASSSCSNEPAVHVSDPQPGEMTVKPGDVVTFGSGPVSVTGGSVTISGEPSWSTVGLALAEPIRFENPEENNGEQPGAQGHVATKEFRRLRGPGLTLHPGEKWFIVLSVASASPGTHTVHSVTVPYRAGGVRRSFTVPIDFKVVVRS